MYDRTPIDELRCMVRYFSYLNETFNQSFTLDQLHKIWLFTQSAEGCTVPELADTWPESLIQKALGNPAFRDYKYDEKCGRRCECTYCKSTVVIECEVE